VNDRERALHILARAEDGRAIPSELAVLRRIIERHVGRRDAENFRGGVAAVPSDGKFSGWGST
jgi:hypothetical protein